MPQDITVTLYQYSELSEKAKEKARAWFIESNDAPLDGVLEGMKEDGVNAVAYDIYRRTIKIELLDGALNVMNHILQNHGESCATYKAALAHENALDGMPEIASLPDDKQSRAMQAYDSLEEEFIEALSEAYLDMMIQEYEYTQSEEYIREAMAANEYTFLDSGKRFG